MAAFVTTRRIHKEGFSEAFNQEVTRELREKIFGSMPLYGGKGGSDAETVGGPKAALGDHEFYATIYSLGALFGRGKLELKDRAAIVLAILTTLPRPELVRIWVNACLNVGWTEEEITELVIWTSFFGGSPAMRGAGLIAVDVFEKRRRNPELKMA